MIEIVISNAIAAQRRTIQASDIELAMRWITGASKTKIGFFP
jgi:histone H3/H4